MDLFNAETMFSASIILYIAAMICAAALLKNHRASNILSNLLCALGAVLGITASIGHILLADEKISLLSLSSTIPLINIQLKIDMLSAYFLLVLFVLVFAVSIYSIGYISHYYGKRNVGLFNFLYAGFILSMVLVITAGNFVTFFMAWEIMSVVSYFLVVFEHEKKENCKAGTVYLIMTHVGAAFILIAFLLMHTYGIDSMPTVAKNVAFVFLMIGFGTKAGIIPFHIWLPKAHPAASSNISALMSGFMIKTAIYGILRFTLLGMGISSAWWGIVILCLGIIAAVLGVAYALMEHNIKKLLAFHSIENIGIIFIGLGIGFIAIAHGNDFVAALAILAALLHTFNHALFKGGLFLGAGAIQYATHTKDIEELGGLIKRMPYTAFFVLCFSLAISAIVPFNGFVSEWLTYQAIFANITIGTAGINIISVIAAAALAFAGALAAVCFVKLFGIAFLGNARSEHASEAAEVPKPMLTGMGILAAICLAIGLFPMIFIHLLDNIVREATGLSIANKLTGGIAPTCSQIEISGNSMSMLALLIVIVVLAAGVAPVLRIIGGKADMRSFNTWDCGFKGINPRMQYSATGFSKPIRIVFRILYRPARKLSVTGEDAPYFPDTMEYKVSTVPLFEKYLYAPAIRRLQRLSQRVKLSVQTGSIHLYLFYILLTVLVLMLYSRIY